MSAAHTGAIFLDLLGEMVELFKVRLQVSEVRLQSDRAEQKRLREATKALNG